MLFYWKLGEGEMKNKKAAPTVKKDKPMTEKDWMELVERLGIRRSNHEVNR